MSLLPKYVGARERRVATQIHFDRGREPPQAVALPLFHEESSLGQIHLPGEELHPGPISRMFQDTYRRGIAGKGLVRKGVHLRNR